MTTETPLSDTDRSLAKRTGRFKLLEDGTLEGIVRIEYNGHLSQSYKTENYKESANKREEMLKEAVKKQMSTAEVSDIVIENVTDPEKPFTYQYKLRVPNYGQKTGKRLFFQPGVFEYGSNPMFTSATRKYPVFFHYPWSEADDIEITLPAGFDLDNAEAPEELADTNRIAVLGFNVTFVKETNVLRYKRNFSFGGGGHVLFSAEAYDPIKTLFDRINKSNTHVLAMKQK
jgi:hypothetical protein